MNHRLMRPLAKRQGAPAALLMRFDGNFDDASPNNLTATAYGSVSTSAAQSKFGGASGAFGPIANYLAVPVDLSSGTYTVEAWFYAAQDHGGDNYNLIGGGTHNYPARWICDIGVASGAISLRVVGENNNPLFEYSAPYTLSTWSHLAVVNDAGNNTFSVYIDGVMVGQASAFNPSDLGGIQVGMNGPASSGLAYYIDDLRIVKGLAVYTANFTPPTGPLPVNATPVA